MTDIIWGIGIEHQVILLDNQKKYVSRSVLISHLSNKT